jgi:hypothetical protein
VRPFSIKVELRSNARSRTFVEQVNKFTTAVQFLTSGRITREEAMPSYRIRAKTLRKGSGQWQNRRIWMLQSITPKQQVTTSTQPESMTWATMMRLTSTPRRPMNRPRRLMASRPMRTRSRRRRPRSSHGGAAVMPRPFQNRLSFAQIPHLKTMGRPNWWPVRQ